MKEVSTPARHLARLRLAEKAGEQLTFILFWSHAPSKDGRAGVHCLSQWWPAQFTVDGRKYYTAEHFMMAEKARLFDDFELVGKILTARTPRDAKLLGRQVRGFDEVKWISERYQIVVRGNKAKFEQNPSLLDYLKETRSYVLVEASPFDRVWGIGLKADDPRARKPSEWLGLNMLGFALMDVRSQLAN